MDAAAAAAVGNKGRDRGKIPFFGKKSKNFLKTGIFWKKVFPLENTGEKAVFGEFFSEWAVLPSLTFIGNGV